MRQLTLILCLLATSSLQAQTKEETIEWLNTFGKKILENRSCFRGGQYFQIQIEENYLEIKEEGFLESDDYFKNGFWKTNIQFNSIYYQNADSLAIETRDGYKMVKLKCQEKKGTSTFKWKDRQREDFQGTPTVITLYACTEKEVKQLAKAIMHLAKLSGAIEKPKVKKDTF